MRVREVSLWPREGVVCQWQCGALCVGKAFGRDGPLKY